MTQSLDKDLLGVPRPAREITITPTGVLMLAQIAGVGDSLDAG